MKEKMLEAQNRIELSKVQLQQQQLELERYRLDLIRIRIRIRMSFNGQVCLHIQGICYSDKAPQCNRMTAMGQDTDNKRTIYKYTNRQCTK